MRGLVSVLLCGAVAAGVAGCAATAPEVELEASVVQPRTGIAQGVVAISLTNPGSEPLELVSASLDSELLGEPLLWSDGPATLKPGRTVDLRVPLGTWNCEADATAEATATVEVSSEGTPATVTTVPAPDPTVALRTLWDGACLAEKVASIVDVQSAAFLSSGEAGVAGELVLSTVPTGAEGEVLVTAVQGTTLLAPFDGSSGVARLAFNARLDAAGPDEVRVPIVPNRCDAHALAEDKIGTRIPLEVTVGELSGTLVLPASDEVRAQMYAFYGSYCGLP
ncbi:hypothetical protein M2152_002710 [Microbacteriaceae bacterium SG_E_30_P1]|uniref:Ig-like domain-containing protein n=1 Tax=Antiquaquibacter oligotrophicus TaxID=2880260 RepID=A0ABT6KSP7_9MICO|nr:hypothetical protein [Antiquaquibacter oligotrophicus]MDH6182528.1 hypothetical protein [Antiquaquibacter oligotrophicus]UDF14503.1 hypothetical protein LH407_06480 [Antiquaquibacter oligotrophicus]